MNSGNFKLMGKYAEHGADYLSSTTSMGEGLRMMQEVGANVDEKAMSYIPTFPMGVQTGPQSGTIGSTYTWKAGGICVNQEGKRFVNEQEARVDVREVALEEQPGAVQYDIFTDKIIADLSAAGGDMMYQLYFNPETGRAKNLVKSAATLDELAALINVPAEALKAVHTPIGTPIRAVTPAEIAVSILGELILCRAEIREGEMPAHHGCPMHG